MNEQGEQIIKPPEIKNGEMNKDGIEAEKGLEFEAVSLEEKPNQTPPEPSEENQVFGGKYHRVPGLY